MVPLEIDSRHAPLAHTVSLRIGGTAAVRFDNGTYRRVSSQSGLPHEQWTGPLDIGTETVTSIGFTVFFPGLRLRILHPT